jgi:hypothetical protein
VFATLTLRTRLRPDATRRVRADAARWVTTHAVALAGAGLVAAQFGWTAILLAHSYFRQDDFALLDGALRAGFGWGYLMSPDNGHLMPSGLAIIWVLARVSLYNWLLAGAVIMILAAAASLALLRVLLTLFGARPAILAPLTVYLFAPLSAGTVAWLSAAVKILPLELALFMAADAHVRYLRTRRPRHAVAAAVWLLVGMASADQGAVVPALLFVITVCLTLGSGSADRWTGAARRALTEYRWIWLLYGVLLAGYCAVFFTQLSASGTALPGPGETTRLYRFAAILIGTSAVPGALGGPWRWAASGYAQAAPPDWLEYLSWGIAAIVVAVSAVRGRAAWSAWAILLGWIVVADIVPVAVEGFGTFSVTTLGADTGYLADATGVLALCAGLAFLPPRMPPEAAARPVPEAAARPVRGVALAALAIFLAGSAVSLPAFVAAAPPTARSYIATARAAIEDMPRGTVVVDGPVPATVMSPGFFTGQAYTSRVIAPLAGGGPRPRLSWTASPAGVLASPMMFDDTGRLRPLAIAGPSSVRPPGTGCLTVAAAGTSIQLDGSLYRWSWIIRMSYSGPAGVLVIGFGGNQSQVSLPAGRHDVYVPVVGQGSAVSAQFSGSPAGPLAGALCVTGVTVGSPQPALAGQAIPAVPVPG